MNRRKMFGTATQLLMGLAGIVVVRRLPDEPIKATDVGQQRELHVCVHSEPGIRFQNAVVRAVTDDLKRNGPTRDLIVGIVRE